MTELNALRAENDRLAAELERLTREKDEALATGSALDEALLRCAEVIGLPSAATNLYVDIRETLAHIEARATAAESARDAEREKVARHAAFEEAEKIAKSAIAVLSGKDDAFAAGAHAISELIANRLFIAGMRTLAAVRKGDADYERRDDNSAIVERAGWTDEEPPRFTATLVFPDGAPRNLTFNTIWKSQRVALVAVASPTPTNAAGDTGGADER